MTISLSALLLYMGALFVLFITPGPVWVAVLARTMAGGVSAAVPLALGVGVGDVIWSVFAIFGVSAVLSAHEGFSLWLSYGAAVVLILMGLGVIRHSKATFGEESKLTAPGAVAGFLAGLFAVGFNPKACVFYLALLPGFFDLADISLIDTFMIAMVSFFVPFMGNMILATCVNFVRNFLAKPEYVYRVSFCAGLSLIGVGLAIGLAGG